MINHVGRVNQCIYLYFGHVQRVGEIPRLADPRTNAASPVSLVGGHDAHGDLCNFLWFLRGQKHRDFLKMLAHVDTEFRCGTVPILFS